MAIKNRVYYAPPPPHTHTQLSGHMFFTPPGARDNFLHNNVRYNKTKFAIGGGGGYKKHRRVETENITRIDAIHTWPIGFWMFVKSG